jgi:RNA recognition motif-containing protein
MPVKPGKRGWAGWNQVDPEGKEPKKGKGKVPTSVFSQNKFDTMERSKSPPQVEPREENLRGQGFSLIIRNLARETRLEQLRSLFEPFGVVIDAYIPRTYHQN